MHAPTPEQKRRALRAANGESELTVWDWLRGVGRSVVEGVRILAQTVKPAK